MMPQSHPPACTLTARWVFPVDGPPLPGGVVTVAGERILAVEAHASRKADFDLGNAAILPGLVNAHTHLDLTGLRDKVPPSSDFTGWLRAIIRHRLEQTPALIEADIRAGLAESIAHGTTLLADVAGNGASWSVLAEAPIRSVVFRELLGLMPARAQESWAAARDWLDTRQPTAQCRPGLSPHAPYSVHRKLYRQASQAARRQGLPIMTHLAETAAEVQLLKERRGPFVEFLSDLGVWYPRGLFRSVEEVVASQGTATVLYAHGNYLSERPPLPSSATVVYCPRTHAAFGHPPHPFRALMAAGVRVALGTDSLASNPDLSVLSEARFLRAQHPDVPGATLLRLATLAGAEALNWQTEIGSLTPGKSADLIMVPLPEHEGDDPHDLVLLSSAPVSAVMSRGWWLSGPQATHLSAKQGER